MRIQTPCTHKLHGGHTMENLRAAVKVANPRQKKQLCTQNVNARTKSRGRDPTHIAISPQLEIALI